MKKILSIAFLVAGVQAAFAVCLGTVHVKLPDSWTSTYVYFAKDSYLVPRAQTSNVDGYTIFDLGKVVTQAQDNGFALLNSSSTVFSKSSIDANQYNVYTSYGSNPTSLIPCPGEGNETYVFENPKVKGQTVVSSTPPDIKYIYFLVPPEDDDWMAAIPMVSLDGGLTGARMKADTDHCGWFYYTFFEEPVTDNVVFMRDDAQDLEHAIGINGTIEEADQAQPIPLQTYYTLSNTNELYFIPVPEMRLGGDDDFGFYVIDPMVDGSCSFTLAALLYDTDAQLHPAFSCDYYKQGESFNEGCQNGVTKLGVDATTAQTRVQSCIGVTTGIVVDTLGLDKKPHLNTAATGNGVKCFGTEQLFDMLFNYTPNVNEMSCYDMPVSRNEKGRWEFDSDKFTNPGTTIRGGFFPLETSTDASILMADPNQTPLSAARTRRAAQGPVYMIPYMRQVDPALGEEALRMELVCNSSTWTGGHNCEGKYAGGGDLYEWYPRTLTGETIVGDDVWCWGAYCNGDAPEGWPLYLEGTGTVTTDISKGTPRWGTDDEGSATNATRRNQHFCFESHANFVYKKGQRLSIRGDDDIWVYIDNKLAVDLGGVHLAAPGYVILDNFKGKSGDLMEGRTYDLDIFFCDRRTTMSNFSFWTNIYIMQKTGITDKISKQGSTETHELCIVATGGGGCASQLGGRTSVDTICDIVPTYSLTRGNGDMVMESVPVGTISRGCIDLTMPSIPVITKDKCMLGPGRYNLIATVEGKSKKISFKVNGELDIATRDAIAIDSNGTTVPGNYAFTKAAMGGEFVPLYISAIADPCQGNAACNEPLEMDLASAPGQPYTLDADPGLTVYMKNAAGQFEVMPAGMARTIGASGVDTVYVTAALIGMMQNPTVYQVGVAGRAKAAITFFAPTILFMADDTTTTKTLSGDPDDFERWVGGNYDFYLAAFKPNYDGTMSFCTTCNFPLTLGSMTSPDIKLLDESIAIVNGHAKIRIRSSAEYLANDNPAKRNPAMIHITGENPNLTSAIYTPVYFREPPEGVDPNSSSSGNGSKGSSSSNSGNGNKNSSNSYDDDDYEDFAPPSFHIELTGSFSFKIVFDKDSRRTKKYAVMDLMGGIVEQGETGSMEASVNLRNAGSYIVRVGHKSTVVNVNKAEEK